MATATTSVKKALETQEDLQDRRELVPHDREIRIDLPGTEVPRGRAVLTASGLRLRTGQELDLLVDTAIQGIERAVAD